jgi:hypothetical protein
LVNFFIYKCLDVAGRRCAVVMIEVEEAREFGLVGPVDWSIRYGWIVI